MLKLTLYLQTAHGVQDRVKVGIAVGGGAVGDLSNKRLPNYFDICQNYQDNWRSTVFCPPDRLICGINWGTLFHSLTSTFSREVEAVTRSSASVAASETAEEKDCSADANSAPWLSSESEIF